MADWPAVDDFQISTEKGIEQHKKASASSIYSSGYTAGKADNGTNGWSPKGND